MDPTNMNMLEYLNKLLQAQGLPGTIVPPQPAEVGIDFHTNYKRPASGELLTRSMPDGSRNVQTPIGIPAILPHKQRREWRYDHTFFNAAHRPTGQVGPKATINLWIPPYSSAHFLSNRAFIAGHLSFFTIPQIGCGTFFPKAKRRNNGKTD